MSEEKPTPGGSNELGEILSGLREWRQAHPKATMAEIERETMKRMAGLQARLIEELSQEHPDQAEQPHCPACGSPMQRRGPRKRRLQGAGDQAISLEREYWVCPVCGTGIFPPG
jgi:hypothetical protein